MAPQNQRNGTHPLPGEALSYGVDGIVTDHPSALDNWIAETAPGT